MDQLTASPLWPSLQARARKMPHLRELFSRQPDRFSTFHASCGEVLLDYSRQQVDEAALAELLQLLEKQNYAVKLRAMLAGEPVNRSENHAALHVALRAPEDAAFMIKGRAVGPDINAERTKALNFAEAIRARQLKGATGEVIDTIIHVGIGGSDLGPRLVVDACRDEKSPTLHFVGNVDGLELDTILKTCTPGRTFVLLASKSFTTAETTLNGKLLKEWLGPCSKQIAALTAMPDKAREFGIDEAHIFRFWDWVGGRYSIWSSIGLPAMLAMGRDAFMQFLAGAAAMDAHVLQAPLGKNLAALMAAFSVWNINLLGTTSRAVLPYAESLSNFPGYLQQLEMESLGKQTDIDGTPLSYNTAPTVFGTTGTPAQHAFMQALHQGNIVVPADIICVRKPAHKHAGHHTMLLANALAQADALAFGRETSPTQPAFRRFDGNRPSSILVLNALSPFALGQLIALYEHKVFAESVFWHINPFDQWGVELGKTLAQPIAAALTGKGEISPSLQGLIDYLRKN